MNKKEMPVIWFDTDTGVDDAIALLAAAVLDRKGIIKLAGVSAVCGNVEQEKTFANARNVLFLAGRDDIPVYPGAESPLKRPLETAKHVHGENGLGDAVIAPSPAPAETKPAWDALYECAKAWKGKLELVLVGPQTNAAIALQKHPDLKQYLKRILVMGGALEGGNTTPYAEYNIYVDPEAAKEVFAAGLPMVMCGLDVTMKAMLLRPDIDLIEGGIGKGNRFFRELTRVSQIFYRRRVGDCYCGHDVCPVLFAAWPEFFSGRKVCIEVIAREGEHLGQTAEVSDAVEEQKRVFAVTGIDRLWFARKVKKIMDDV